MAEPSRKKSKIQDIVKAVERSLVGVLNKTIDQTPPPRRSTSYLDFTEGSILYTSVYYLGSYSYIHTVQFSASHKD